MKMFSHDIISLERCLCDTLVISLTKINQMFIVNFNAFGLKMQLNFEYVTMKTEGVSGRWMCSMKLSDHNSGSVHACITPQTELRVTGLWL